MFNQQQVTPLPNQTPLLPFAPTAPRSLPTRRRCSDLRHLHRRRNDSSRLPPGAAETNKRGHETGETANAIIKLDPAQAVGGEKDIAAVAQQLGLDRDPLLVDLFLRQAALGLRLGDAGLLGAERGKRVEAGNDGGGETKEPELLGKLGEVLGALRGGELANLGGVEEDNVVEGKVAEVAELAQGGEVGLDRVGLAFKSLGRGKFVSYNLRLRAGDSAIYSCWEGGRGDATYSSEVLEVLDVLAETHSFPDNTELRLHGAPWGDSSGGIALAEKVPGEEAGEVLEGTEDLVTADGGGDEAEVVGGEGMGGDGDERSDGGHCGGWMWRVAWRMREVWRWSGVVLGSGFSSV